MLNYSQCDVSIGTLGPHHRGNVEACRLGVAGLLNAGVPLRVHSCSLPVPRQAGAFVHPGGLHKNSDAERMRYMFLAEVDPWASSARALLAHSQASSDYEVRGDVTRTTLAAELVRGTSAAGKRRTCSPSLLAAGVVVMRVFVVRGGFELDSISIQ